jgi:hypothetical protein
LQHGYRYNDRPPASIEAIKDTIRYLREYNVLVCKQHATATQNLDAHLRDQHAIARKLREEIVRSYQHKWAQCREDIKTPALLGLLIDELGAPLDGLQCAEEDCNFITVRRWYYYRGSYCKATEVKERTGRRLVLRRIVLADRHSNVTQMHQLSQGANPSQLSLQFFWGPDLRVRRRSFCHGPPHSSKTSGLWSS